jgi:hypothetical protein
MFTNISTGETPCYHGVMKMKKMFLIISIFLVVTLGTLVALSTTPKAADVSVEQIPADEVTHPIDPEILQQLEDNGSIDEVIKEICAENPSSTLCD